MKLAAGIKVRAGKKAASLIKARRYLSEGAKGFADMKVSAGMKSSGG